MAAKKKYSISFLNSHLISVISISLVLFLIGLILVMGFLGNELSQYMKENVSMSVVLNEDLSDKDVRNLRDKLESRPYVKSTEYISKEQAALEMQRELGETPEAFLGYNPFHASLEIKLNADYTHPDSFPKIEKQIASEATVSKVQYQKDMMRDVNHNIRKIGIVLIILVIVLMVISFVLVNNTVRLLIYSKRFLIYTMRLVGATSEFIRRPFIRYNILTGFIAGLLAILMLAGALYYVKKEFPDSKELFSSDIMLPIYGIVLLSGILMAVVAAYFAVNKYLRISRGKLYHM